VLSFFKRHELVQMIHEGEVRTFSGSQNTTRRPVPLHSPGDKASHLTIIWQGEAPVSSPACSAPKGVASRGSTRTQTRALPRPIEAP
jgi:hypothetical protein